MKLTQQVKYFSDHYHSSLKDDDDMLKSFYCFSKQTQRTLSQHSTAIKNTVSWVLHANVCLPIVVEVHSQCRTK